MFLFGMSAVEWTKKNLRDLVRSCAELANAQEDQTSVLLVVLACSIIQSISALAGSAQVLPSNKDAQTHF